MAIALAGGMPSELATVASVHLPSRERPTARDRIVDASLTLVGERGERALTIRAIAARCGVPATQLYRHFSGKQALVVELSRHGAERLGRWLDDPAWGAAARGSGLEALCHRYLEFARDRPRLYDLMFRADPAPTEQFTLRAALLMSETARASSRGPQQLWLAMHGLAVNLTRRAETTDTPGSAAFDTDFIDEYIATLVRAIGTCTPAAG
jgi:AcrR family transcriptional regulator